MSLNEKVAIVTGASKGIGKAISLGLAKLNYKLILIGRNKNDLEIVASEIIRTKGIPPLIYQVDITDFLKVKNTVQEIIKSNGRIDVLVNNAGIFTKGSLKLDTDAFQKMIDTNLTAQFFLLKEVIPVMKKQQSGYVFNVASRSGKIGFAGDAGYNTSKFGLVGLSETLYRELTPLGIKVTTLCPGWVNTKMAYEAGTKLEPEEMIQPEDLFKTVKWLLTLSPGSCVREVMLETPFSIS